MFKLDYVKPDEADGAIAEAYSQFPEAFGVPAPLQLLSVSPGLFECQMKMIGYYRDKSGFEFAVPAAIRYLAARKFGLKACEEFNARLLKAAGMGEDELERIHAAPADGPFDERENRLIWFVSRVLDGEEMEEKEIDSLRDLGWSDTNIYDACSQGTFMAGAKLMMNAFSIES